ncbi:MAG: cohesin domain-containing protein [Ignavibacteriales bacterium]|nr:cohesin domain-containing protein [Ignavibacteriales bacterium]
MRRILSSFLIFAWAASMYGQTLTSPAKTFSPTLTGTKITFTWTRNSSATYGYEIYFVNATSDPGTSVPSVAVNTTTGYVSVAQSANASITYTPAPLQTGKKYYWKVRAKIGSGATPTNYAAWTTYSYFEIGTPAASITNGNVAIGLDHEFGRIATLIYKGGSNAELLDTANGAGIGYTGAGKDTIVSWTEGADTSTYVYQNSVKYGATGSKSFLVAHSASGIIAEATITLAAGKSVSMATSWKPGGNLSGSDFAVFDNGTVATRVGLTYPSSDSSIGPATAVHAVFFDKSKDEYAGFKAASAVSVQTKQNATALTQTITLSATATIKYAVKKKADYFAWTPKKYIFVTAPAAGDSLAPGEQDVTWESYGWVPDSVALSTNGGTSYANGRALTSGEKSASTAKYVVPTGSLRSNSVIGVFKADSADALAKSGVFVITEKAIAVTAPAANASVAPGSLAVTWTNSGGTLTSIKVSTDSGSTWGNTTSITGAKQTSATGSLSIALTGASEDLTKCFVGLFEGAATSPAAKSGLFTITKGGAKFSMPKLYSDPGADLVVPVTIKSTLTGTKIRAFDIKLTYDKQYMRIDNGNDAKLYKADGTTLNSGVGKWTLGQVEDTTTAGADKSNVIVSGFAPDAGESESILKIYFTVDTSASQVGNTTNIKMALADAADNNAQAIPVVSTSNTELKILTSISGSITYFAEDGASSTYKLSADSLMIYADSNDVVADVDNGELLNSAVVGVGKDGQSAGNYKIARVEAGHEVTYYPSFNAFPADLNAAIDATDAALAFLATFYPDTISNRAKIAADVNEDGLVNSIDALSIMDIVADTWYDNAAANLKRWIFVDTASIPATELTDTYDLAWRQSVKEQITANPLASGAVYTKKDFMGVLRGDVDFSYAGSANHSLNKSGTADAKPVICSLPVEIQSRAGDTVCIPLNIQLNGNSVLAFTATIQVDQSMFSSFAGIKEGPAFPSNKGWYTVTKYDSKTGILVIATTDLSGTRDAMNQEGSLLTLKFVVSNDAKRGATSQISIPRLSLSDQGLKKLSASATSGQVEITRLGAAVVMDYALSQNYPNPFNPTTTIEFALPKESTVEIQIFNTIGQRVANLYSGVQTAGNHQIVWNASGCTSGIYFYTLKAVAVSDGKDFHAVKKLVLMK